MSAGGGAGGCRGGLEGVLGPAGRQDIFDHVGRQDVEIMEQQKARHYVAQMALSEKQLSILAGDVGVLREEVGALAHSFLALRDSHDQRGLLVSRVRALEEASKATGARWERRLSSIESQLVASINSHVKSLVAPGIHPDVYAQDVAERKRSHAHTEERLSKLEAHLTDSRWRSKDSTVVALLHERVDCFEREFRNSQRQLKSLQDYSEPHDRNSQNLDEKRRAAHAFLEERVAYLEKELGDSAENHARMLQDHSESHDRHSQDLDERRAAHASLEERMAYLEKELGDSAQNHARMLQDHSETHGKHSQDLDERRAAHASLEERVAYLEKELGDSAENHARMLQDHSESHDRHSQDLDERRAAHASLEERMAYLEKELGDSAQNYARMLQDHSESHDRHSQGLDERRTAHASLEERLVEFQGRVADVEGSLREDLKDLQDLRAFYRRHSSLPERVTWLEQEHASAAERRVAETVSLRRLHEEIRGMHDGTCLEARVGALERKEAQSVRQLDLLADCLQRELRAKSSQLRRPSSPASLALPAGGDSPEGTVPSRPSPAAPPSEPSARGIWWG